MANYYVNRNAQSNGDQEVHVEGCRYMPELSNRVYLGSYTHCSDAVKKSKEIYSKSNGCYYCCPQCHTS